MSKCWEKKSSPRKQGKNPREGGKVGVGQGKHFERREGAGAKGKGRKGGNIQTHLIRTKVLAFELTTLVTTHQSRLSGASVSDKEDFKLGRSLVHHSIYMLASFQAELHPPDTVRVKRKENRLSND